MPETLVSPVSALLVERAGSATRAFAPSSHSVAVDRRDLAAVEFQERVVFEKDRSGLHPLVPNPAAALATSSVAWTVALPSMLISLRWGWRARLSRYRQCVGRRDAGVADVEAVAAVAAVGQRSADRQARAPGAADVGSVEPHRGVAGDAQLPVVATVAPFCRRNCRRGCSGRPARCCCRLRRLGDPRIRAVEPQRAVDRRDLAALEFQQRIVLEDNRPGLHAFRAEPRRRIGDVQRRLDRDVAFDVDLAVAALESPCVPFTVKVSAEVMSVLPIETPLLLVLLLVSCRRSSGCCPRRRRCWSRRAPPRRCRDAQIAGGRDLCAVLR